jgi:hypothetical protein
MTNASKLAFFTSLVLAALNSLSIAARAAQIDCDLKNVALVRVSTKEARLNFIAGPGKLTPQCPSAQSTCKLKAFLVPGDEVLIGAANGPYVCATFKSKPGIQTSGWLPSAALEMIAPEGALARSWQGKWQADQDREIVVTSNGDEVSVSGTAVWGSHDPERVKRGGVHTGELEGKSRPRAQTLAIGYDPDRVAFPPSPGEAPDACAAQLKLLGRYLLVEDNGMCGGANVTFTGLYVRVGQN